VWVAGPKTCNCGELGATVQVCHTESFDITVGNKQIGTFSTGQSSSVCTTLTLPPGTCTWNAYKFRCCKIFGLFSGWHYQCKYEQHAVKTGPAGAGDCPPSPLRSSPPSDRRRAEGMSRELDAP